jgi:hypothetical protein
MNEQIQELWNKAATVSAAYPSGQNNSWETQVNFIETFAKLIVIECIEIMHTNERIPEGFFYPKAAHIHELVIKQHFGIDNE